MSPVVDLVLPPAEAWQAQARAARISTADLLAHIGLIAADFAEGVIAQPDFPLSVPPHYLSLIRRGDPADPLLLQVLARGEEALPQPGRLTDPVDGAAHFDVDEARARTIEAELRAALPGYLVPRIVREVPGQAGKTPLWALST